MRLSRSGWSAFDGIVGVEVGQRRHGEDFAGVGVEDDAGGGERRVALHGAGQLVVQDVLDAEIDRQAHRLDVLVAGEAGGVKIGEAVVVDVFLEAGDALVVDVDEAEDVGGGRPAGIEAAALLQEADAGNAEGVDLLLLLGRDLALDPDEAGVAGELLAQLAWRRGRAARW